MLLLFELFLWLLLLFHFLRVCPGLNGHGCQPLGVIVVKFPGQTTQLLFLRGDETTGQSLQFLLVGIQGRLGPLALAQSAHQPDNKCRLQNQQEADANEVMPVLVSDADFLEQHGGASRQKPHVNAMTP